jgi:hypothetical protein
VAYTKKGGKEKRKQKKIHNQSSKHGKFVKTNVHARRREVEEKNVADTKNKKM